MMYISAWITYVAVMAVGFYVGSLLYRKASRISNRHRFLEFVLCFAFSIAATVLLVQIRDFELIYSKPTIRDDNIQLAYVYATMSPSDRLLLFTPEEQKLGGRYIRMLAKQERKSRDKQKKER